MLGTARFMPCARVLFPPRLPLCTAVSCVKFRISFPRALLQHAAWVETPAQAASISSEVLGLLFFVSSYSRSTVVAR
jgi:hypothetical protein